MSSSEVYILLKNRKASARKCGFTADKNSVISVLPGSIWGSNCKHDNILYGMGNPSLKLSLTSLEIDDVVLNCPATDVERISQEECDLLIALPTLGDRLRIFKNKDWLNEGLNMNIGQIVKVLDLKNLSENVTGKIRYKGFVSGLSGINFGVELSAPWHTRGKTDGVFRNQRYFTCPRDSAIFLPISKIRLSENQWDFNDASEPDYIETVKPPLSINERVVWISDDGPQHGAVKWIGILPDTRDKDWTVGVEFDKPIGTGTGKYKDSHLFRTRQNHASFIPIMGLIREEVFYNTEVTDKKSDGDTTPSELSSPDFTNEKTFTSQTMYSDPSPDDMPLSAFSVASTLCRNSNDEREPNVVSQGLTMEMIDKETEIRNKALMEEQARLLEQFSKDRLEIPVKTLRQYSSDYLTLDELTDNTMNETRAEKSTENIHDIENEANKSDAIPIYASVLSKSQRKTQKNESLNKSSRCSLEDRFSSLDISRQANPNKEKSPNEEHVIQSPRDVTDASILGDPCPVALSGIRSPVSEEQYFTETLPPPSFDLLYDTPHPFPPSTTGDTIVKRVPPDPPPRRSGSSIVENNDEIYSRIRDDYQLSDSVAVIPEKEFCEAFTSTQKTIKSNRMSSSDEEKPVTNQAVSNPALVSNIDDPQFELGSVVEVPGSPPLYGVIRWIGFQDPGKTIELFGLEMEEANSFSSDGTLNGQRMFICPPNKALFIKRSQCRVDQRFTEAPRDPDKRESQMFGSLECPEIEENQAPLDRVMNLDKICGRPKGIQGHHNSCYLDASLFAMFSFSYAFDGILYRPRGRSDSKCYEEVQKIIRTSIINPLRKNWFVRADKVMALRRLLDGFSSVEGLISEEKDPEEFINCLLQQVMKADPMIKLSSGQESYMYQLFMEKDKHLLLPTTQQLLALSFLQSDVKLSEAPSCMILLMPRFGKDYKLYNRIVPSLNLDITDILEYGIRQCTICGTLATHECKECYRQFGESVLAGIAFCDICIKKCHTHSKRVGHRPTKIKVNKEYLVYQQQCSPFEKRDVSLCRDVLELFAIISIQTSHYVAFVKCGRGSDAQWIFFDSMADRIGGQHGYNIPEIRHCPELADWLREESYDRILNTTDEKNLPTCVKRVICDSYMCFYQSLDLLQYK